MQGNVHRRPLLNVQFDWAYHRPFEASLLHRDVVPARFERAGNVVAIGVGFAQEGSATVCIGHVDFRIGNRRSGLISHFANDVSRIFLRESLGRTE